MKKHKTVLLGLGIFSLVVVAVVAADYWSAIPVDAQASYVGRSACIDCHSEQAALFEGSHHDLAMDFATDSSVIGDFNDAQLTHHGITSRMFRDGDRFMINTEGPTGKMQDFEIKYVFGVDPLQQYMVEFDRSENMPVDEIGRLQVLRVSWDTKAKKWFYLEPPDVNEKLAPDDDLHWTGIAQRWNTMCAECHSTDLQKNFDDKTARYHTTFSEIDVSCEACHGPASIHVELARSKSLFWDRHHGYGLAQLKGPNSHLQVEACAPCHSRRRILQPGYKAGDKFCDFFEPELLQEATYHANGEILDEVYVYGSFLQSKMYHKGIRCSDCHDPHSLKLKAPGNAVCTSCHQHPAGKYDTPSHHKHEPGTSGASCVECHMPETTYMSVDPRRDHSIRIPRPDLSLKAQTPNACTGCHIELEKEKSVEQIGSRFPVLADYVASHDNADDPAISRLTEYAKWLEQSRAGNAKIKAGLAEVDAWCDQACESWYGEQRKREPHFAEALNAARNRQDDALQQLAELAMTREYIPDIARATAIEELRRLSGGTGVLKVAREALESENPILRAAGVRVFEGRDPGTIRRALVPLLSDESRLVRTEAARILTAVPESEFSAGKREEFKSVLEEHRKGIMFNNDRAGAHLAWALLLESRGLYDEARESYETAIRVQPTATGARSNLAALLENLIRSRRIAPNEIPAIQSRVAKLRSEELPLLERDANLAPENAFLQHRVGLALYLGGKEREGLARLERAVELEPQNPEFLLACVLLLEKLQRYSEAWQQCNRLVQLDPRNQQYQALMARLSALAEK